MFAVVEFSDGRYEEADVIREYGGCIEFRTLDGHEYEFKPNHRGLFRECRGVLGDCIFTEKIRRVMIPTNKEGEKELMGYLKKGEKEMTKHKLTEKFLEAQKAVEAARDTLNTAISDLKKVEKMIEEQAKKPKMICKDGKSIEIVKYRKYSDGYVEFETAVTRYKYIRVGKTKEYVLPRNGLHCTLESDIGHVFEVYDSIDCRYHERDYIDHIELLEGVDEYDKYR